jgi:drug/metabolite transporter (DMT)-like permease
MSTGVAIGLLLAVATAVSAAVGMLLKQRGAVESPDVELRRPVRTSLALFRSRWYVIGILVAFGSWGLHVGALALAPISLAQATIAAGLVFLTVLADRFFHLRISRREWVGVWLAAVGLAALALTLDGGVHERHSDHASETLAVYMAATAGIGIAMALWARRGPNGGVLLGASAGFLWGASDVGIKALSDDVNEGISLLIHPLSIVIATLSLVGLVVSARSLQLGPPVAVIAVTGVAANVCTILSGPVVFREPLPDEPLLVAVRVAALALVIVAAAVTPPPAESRDDHDEEPAAVMAERV